MCSLACVHNLFFSTSPHDGFFMSCSILPSFLQLWYDYKQIRIYVIIFACGWFLWFFFLICEDKQLWSWDGAEALYSIVMFMTLSGWVYGIGHTTAIWEKSSLGVGSSLPHCFAFILFVFPEVKTRLLLVLLQYTGLSHSPPALIQQYRILTEISMHLAQMNNK